MLIILDATRRDAVHQNQDEGGSLLTDETVDEGELAVVLTDERRRRPDAGRRADTTMGLRGPSSV